MPPWIRRMTRGEIERAVALAKASTLDEILALAIERHRKDRNIGLWVLASCLIGLAASAYLLTIANAALKDHPAAWCIGVFAALLLPLPVMAYGSAGHREGRVIALAYHLKKDPRFPANRK